MGKVNHGRLISRCIISLVLVLVASLAKPNTNKAMVEGNAASYSLVLNSSNAPEIAGSGYGIGSSIARYVSFEYENAEEIASHHVKLAASGGKISNRDIITRVETIKVVFFGGTLSLGASNHFGEIENSLNLTSNTTIFTLQDAAYYVIYTTGSSDVTISSVTITYKCSNLPIPNGIVLSEYGDGYEVSSYSGPYSSIMLPPYYNGRLITKIGDEVFKNNTLITRVNLPDTVTEIGDHAFYGCSAITEFENGGRLVTIGEYAFYDCSKIINFDFPATLLAIGRFAFAGCSSLTMVNLKSGLTTLHTGTFSMCTSIRDFDIPDTITLIETYAFTSSSLIESLHVPGTILTIQQDAFRRILGCTIYVNAPAKPAGWSWGWVDSRECEKIVWLSSYNK